MEQFTASEVRDLAKRGTDAMQQFIDGRHTLHIPPQHDDADMVIAECLRAMDAFADLLEAWEKTVPVGEVVGVAGSYGEMRVIRWRDRYSPAVGTKLYTRSAQAQPPAASVLDIDVMVTRFLGWRLPQDFAPDAGISFKPMPDIYMPHCWPTGTNLFHAGQAKEMILHMLGAQENPNGV